MSRNASEKPYVFKKGSVRVPIIAHIPHSALYIPPDIRKTLLLNDRQLKRELLLMTDRYVDELFSCVHESGGSLMKFAVSRLVLDPERFLDDSREEMAAKGMGVVYIKTSHGELLRKGPSSEQRENLINRFYIPYHKRLAEEVACLLETHNRCLIIDCHSFSSQPLPYEPDKDAERPDICLGTDDFHAPVELVEAAETLFSESGLITYLNKPYEGTYVPSMFLNKDSRVSSLMIEVNRKLFMDETTGKKTGTFNKVKTILFKLVQQYTLKIKEELMEFNAINVIKPYLWNNVWVFDDPARGLDKEALVSGIPEIITHVCSQNGIRDPQNGFVVIFSGSPFPDAAVVLEHLRPDGSGSGNWYKLQGTNMEGWLCPALLRYFESPPAKIYLQVKPC
jgi:N-formylglutamate amidohydrolase